MTNYNKRFKAKLVQQALLPGTRSVAELARSAGVPQTTLWKWVEEAKLHAINTPPKPPEAPQRPGDRKPQEKLRIVLTAHALEEQDLGALLRREGVHEADLAEWRAALEEAALASLERISQPVLIQVVEIRSLFAGDRQVLDFLIYGRSGSDRRAMESDRAALPSRGAEAHG
jgi:transposase-like protein